LKAADNSNGGKSHTWVSGGMGWKGWGKNGEWGAGEVGGKRFLGGYIWIQTMLIGHAYTPKAMLVCVCVVCTCIYIRGHFIKRILFKIYIEAHMYPKFRVGVCWQTRAAIPTAAHCELWPWRFTRPHHVLVFVGAESAFKSWSPEFTTSTRTFTILDQTIWPIVTNYTFEREKFEKFDFTERDRL